MSPKRLDSNINYETFTGGFPANILSNSIAFIFIFIYFILFFSLSSGEGWKGGEGGKRGVAEEEIPRKMCHVA